MRKLICLALLAVLCVGYVEAGAEAEGRTLVSGQESAAGEVKEPVTLVSFYLSTIDQTHTVMQGAPRGQPRLGRDVLTSGPADLVKVKVRNDDPTRTVTEIEYQLYRTNKGSGAEVAHVNLVDRVKIKPGKASGERPLRWSPDRLGCGRYVNECSLSIRVLRVKYADGSEWVHPKLAGDASGDRTSTPGGAPA